MFKFKKIVWIIVGMAIVLNANTIDNEVNAITSFENKLSWAYYRDKSQSRWYISYTDISNKVDIYSLMAIKNGLAGWATVGKNVASVNLDNKNIIVDYIADNISNTYHDVGWNEVITDPIIQKDIEMIRNSTVNVEWWFFQASNGFWYIINKEGFVYKFASKDGLYDWIRIDMGNYKPIFKIENSEMKVSFTETPFILNSPINESANFPKVGCNFSDILEGNQYYTYAIALCQSNIDLGTQESNFNKFEPNRLATWAEILKIANLSKDYNAMTYKCTETKYNNLDKSQCHLDYALNLGFQYSANENITLGIVARYIFKLFYDKELSETEAINLLVQQNIFNGTNENMTRGEVAKLILTVAGIHRLEDEKNLLNTNASNSFTLPYGINPPSINIPLITPTVPSSSSNSGIKLIDGYELLGWDIGTNTGECDPIDLLLGGCTPQQVDDWYDIIGFNNEITLPSFNISQSASIQTPTNINKTTSEKIVESAKNNIGLKAPFVDSQNTHDLIFVNATLGLPTIHTNTQVMTDEYKNNGDIITLEESKNGDIIVYKPEASSDGLPHIAIKSSDTAEIGIPNFGGVQETNTIKDKVDFVIPSESFSLPSIAGSDIDDIHSNRTIYATYINNSNTIYGRITENDVDMFQIVLNENQEFWISSKSLESIYIRVTNSLGEELDKILMAGFDGTNTRKIIIPKTGLYYINVHKQGYFTKRFEYKLNFACGINGESCPKIGDYDSIDNPRYLNFNETKSYNIDYQGDTDYFVLHTTKTGLVNIRIKSKLINSQLDTNFDINEDKYQDMAVIMKKNNDATKTMSWWNPIYLDKDNYYVIQVRSSSSKDTEPYAIQITDY